MNLPIVVHPLVGRTMFVAERECVSIRCCASIRMIMACICIRYIAYTTYTSRYIHDI